MKINFHSIATVDFVNFLAKVSEVWYCITWIVSKAIQNTCFEISVYSLNWRLLSMEQINEYIELTSLELSDQYFFDKHCVTPHIAQAVYIPYVSLRDPYPLIKFKSIAIRKSKCSLKLLSQTSKYSFILYRE